ncbi:thymidylate synthase, partial [Vibrio anguillarum]|nr:thymidylate synthase [Vibrio anguillarum]
LSILFYKTEIIGHCGANGAAIKTDNCP